MLKKLPGHRVLVRKDRLEEIDPTYKKAKAAGIEIPKEFREAKLEQNAVDRGTVVMIGPLCWTAPVGDGTAWCEIGDRIIFAKYSGSYLRGKDIGDDEEYMIINDEDVLGVL